jgi:neutral ceramidase
MRRVVFLCAVTVLANAVIAAERSATEPSAKGFEAGVARKAITPDGPVWMSGFAFRKHVSEGVLHDLWAKALALRDPNGERFVMVTIDVIGLPREVSDPVAARVKAIYGLERRQLMFNASHTHGCPIIWPNLASIFQGTPEDQQNLLKYRDRLIENLVEVVGKSLDDLSPATLTVGHGSAHFSVNRRELKRPVDPDVPVLKIAAPDGRVRAVLFGYACHNVSMGLSYKINGDFAGFAQIDLEKAMPGASAMFFQLCGAEQNPRLDGDPESKSKELGQTLAAEVQRVLEGPMKPIEPDIRTDFGIAQAELQRQDRSVFEEEAKHKKPEHRRRAKTVLDRIDSGRMDWHVPVPVQVVALGDKLVLLGIGGEVVDDYSTRLKRDFPQIDLIVAGYTNEVMCYIPSRRVLDKGDYEAVNSMVWYNQPGPFAGSVEETVISACHRLLKKLNVKPVK